jgi:transcriptional regulator GlxA family with amidase domain
MKTRQTERYRLIVGHFEEVARANVTTLMRVSDLCVLAGINQRTLSRALREVRGMGPYRYLLFLRLSEVRRILASEQVTVTQAAMQFGFREPGRFAALYKKSFGESPSETKRRNRAVRDESQNAAPRAVKQKPFRRSEDEGQDSATPD